MSANVARSGVTRRIDRARTDPRRHALALTGAILVGFVAAWMHWSGLVLAGALLGIVSPSLPRAVANAIGFGVVVLFAFAVSIGASVESVVGMAPVVYVTVGSAVGLPALGALVRGIV